MTTKTELLDAIRSALGTSWAASEDALRGDDWTSLHHILFGDYGNEMEREYPHLVVLRELAEVSRHFDHEDQPLRDGGGHLIPIRDRRTAHSPRTKARYQAYRDAVRSLILYP